MALRLKQKIGPLFLKDIFQTKIAPERKINHLSRYGCQRWVRLKQLFHHFFDCTPHAMLTHIRMQTAYKMLETGDYHVGIVADHVGYQHPNNFSAAFRKFFSISPKEVARKR